MHCRLSFRRRYFHRLDYGSLTDRLQGHGLLQHSTIRGKVKNPGTLIECLGEAQWLKDGFSSNFDNKLYNMTRYREFNVI